MLLQVGGEQRLSRRQGRRRELAYRLRRVAGRGGQVAAAVVLMSNAGSPPRWFHRLRRHRVGGAFELTFISSVRLMCGVIPHMRRAGGGRIVQVGSSSIVFLASDAVRYMTGGTRYVDGGMTIAL